MIFDVARVFCLGDIANDIARYWYDIADTTVFSCDRVKLFSISDLPAGLWPLTYRNLVMLMVLHIQQDLKWLLLCSGTVLNVRLIRCEYYWSADWIMICMRGISRGGWQLWLSAPDSRLRTQDSPTTYKCNSIFQYRLERCTFKIQQAASPYCCDTMLTMFSRTMRRVENWQPSCQKCNTEPLIIKP